MVRFVGGLCVCPRLTATKACCGDEGDDQQRQKCLRNRVSYTQVINNATDTYPAGASYYTYDIHGNVDTLLQDFGNSSGIANAMNLSGNRFKKIVYNYDLISGKVNQVSYQPGQTDAYYHRYVYDGENRLTDAYSGRDSVILLLFPEREARYTYYKHGPLARAELGQLRVQGMDYAYMLQGWLKAVNPDSSISGVIAKNVYSFILNYYNNDYRGIGVASPSAGIPSQLGSDNKQLFNGNISSMGVNIPKLGNSILYNFQYDQLNRLIAMDAWTSTNNVWAGLSKVNDYKERLTYDANGNILSYLRNGTGSSLNLNNYTYSYTAGTNRLASITNSINSNTGTYSYDAIGNVTKDDKQNVSTASWNVYGKLQSVTKTGGTQIDYTYDASGNRILKKVADTTEAYVRDAGGNIMSVYKKAGSGSLKQSEIGIYGSSMIGNVSELSVAIQTVTLSGGFGGGIVSTFTRGEKEYLLTDHRGNNIVSITDRRQQYSAGGVTVDYYIADVKTATYYSAYGAISNSYNADSIKYAFNGQRRSMEISSTAQTAMFWEYNADVGRRWNVDPVVKVWLSPYSCFRDNPLFYVDPNGDDDFFDINGKYLGSVGSGHLVRVITNQKISMDEAAKNVNKYTRLLSEFEYFPKNKANRDMLLNVVNFYGRRVLYSNVTKQKKVIKIWDVKDKGSNAVFAYLQNDYNEYKKGYYVAVVNGKINIAVDQRFNIFSSLEHEKKHENDPETGNSYIRHVDAIIAEMNSDYFKQTTWDYKLGSIRYAQKLLNNALSEDPNNLDAVKEKIDEFNANSEIKDYGSLYYDESTKAVGRKENLEPVVIKAKPKVKKKKD